MSHIPVLLHEALTALCIQHDGLYSIAHSAEAVTHELFWLSWAKVVD